MRSGNKIKFNYVFLKMSKRVVTSAISGMSVGEVRKGLDYMRKRWKDQNRDEPFFIDEEMPNGMVMQDFALQFVMGHHYKRHNKQRRPARSSMEQDDDDYPEDNLSEDDVQEEVKRAKI